MNERLSEDWVSLSDEELLKVRIRDLHLKIEGTELEQYVQQLYGELEERNIAFHPSCYLSDEWVSPDGEPVVGIPFFLVHPRLKELERRMVLEVEGGTESSCMRLLRHETGHAINYAYLLHRRRRWRQLFGPFSLDYPDTYRPRSYSRRFVSHLEDWYAQYHPDEDFAETFAVWLTPNLDWRKMYRGWKALEKLEYVDRLMMEVAQKPPHKESGEKLWAVPRLKLTLRTYYERKRRLYAEDYPDFYDADLKAIFSEDEAFRQGEAASRTMRRHRKAILDNVSHWTGENKYRIDRVMRDLIERCDELGLHVAGGELDAVLKVTAYVTTLIMNYLHTGRLKRDRFQIKR